MSTKTVLITGGNAGLGLEIVRALYQSQQTYYIFLGSRSLEKAQAAIDGIKCQQLKSSTIIQPIQIDVEDDLSISLALEEVEKKYGSLDILVNNAGKWLYLSNHKVIIAHLLTKVGVAFDGELHGGKIGLREAWNKSWAVNTAGAHVMTYNFAPLLLKSTDPRLVFVASGTATLTGHATEERFSDKAPPKGWPKQELSWSAYRSSKTGMNMMMREWARVLKEDGVKVWAVSPGLLATNLGGDPEFLKNVGALDPKVGADLVKDVIEGKRDADVGKVVNKAGIQPW
ncbi:nadp-binding [Trichoderma arundinaceum]|uniref:Nadp-binding n=1 Tax=Trichoderma arundinaceum TaxID=490622 RepID=A0A395NY89_TRIAR|nr:nadp-binding [Trichoderma arundinaceum]